MATSGDKPLPDIPPRGLHPHELTIEASAHLRRFISWALEEEEMSVSRQEWAHTIENALREVGDNISHGGWLTGIRRARNVRKLRRREQDAQRRRERVDEAKEKTSKARAAMQDSEQRVADEPGPLPDPRTTPLRQLRGLVGTHTIQPVPKPPAKHLLLTVESFSACAALTQPGVECSFVANAFVLPGEHASEEDDTQPLVLYGLDEWDACLYDEERTQIVGGTFHFRGTLSSAQHLSLTKVLRLSLYVYLSLLLEQDVLANSSVELHFPKPSVPVGLPESVLERPLPPIDQKHKSKRENTVAGGIWSYFSKKTGTLLQRAGSVGPSLTHRGSFELPLTRTLSSQASPHAGEGLQRQRRFSLISAASSSSNSAREGDTMTKERQQLFRNALRHIESTKDRLSTSPGVVFSPPPVLLRLAKREEHDPSRRLTGDEKAALASILGWEGKESGGRGIADMSGFVRQQGISLLHSTHIPLPLLPQPSPTPSIPGLSPSIMLAPTPCSTRKKRVTYRYYQRESMGGSDETLGEMITRLCTTADEFCDEPGCQYRHADHDLRWIHAGVRVVATVSPPERDPEEPPADQDADTPSMWYCCAVCGQQSQREPMRDGTYLYSFGKYLELLIYSPSICALTPPLCEHITRNISDDDVSLPKCRLNIHRKFAYNSRIVTFSLSTVEDMFELQVPRLQIVRRRVLEKSSDEHSVSAAQNPSHQGGSAEDDRRALRREIKCWWQGLAEHIDQLEENFVTNSDSTFIKTLPRLPSEDDACDIPDETGTATPKPSLQRLPSTSTTSTAHTVTPDSLPRRSAEGVFNALSHFVVATSSHSVNSPADSQSSQNSNSLYLLSGLRHAFQKEEQDLYAELSRTPTLTLNNVRRSFVTVARGASRRLQAWETKHSSHIPKSLYKMNLPNIAEPEWWQAGCHAVPGGNVIVREDDWGSIIAFTLSSEDYHRELANMSITGTANTSVLPAPPATPFDPRSSLFSAGTSFRKLLSSNSNLPDPDQDGIVWSEPESCSAVISRKEHPKDATSLISIRDVLRHKTSTDASDAPSSSRLGVTGSVPGNTHNPPSARAKPAVELSMQVADGHISGMPEAADRVLLGLEANSSSPSTWRNSGSHTTLSDSTFVETKIRSRKTASVVSTDSDTSLEHSSNSSREVSPPPVPPKEQILRKELPPHPPDSHNVPSSFAVSLTNTLSSAMKYMLKPHEAASDTPALTPHHGLLSTASPAIGERPHIKYEWTIGKRLKFSCTVYYAKQFDSLRRRCGIEDAFLRSLARSENWAAEGGKSRSNFWKTSDDQFIIKTLVNAWNVADLQVLIELGPSYFRHMDATATRPSVLAKLLGFYTVEIRNIESGATQAKADLLVMENLFFKQKISKAFDLKGIQGRKVKSSSNSKTLFDGEWIEDQRRALTLVHPHSKVVFQEAIRTDCDFLARSNIMDYSLLLGVDEENKRIACGLVDTIGSYTFAKTLEYKAKQNLNAGKEVTVVPPYEYQERFVSAMDDYFLACPDKWSRPLDDSRIPHGYKSLPSVL
ncbi:hypothetical protein WOLCODRAFT_139614 [Wolfiporia cocos MD-104 SS10]|uniref:PIPK domain-containing protein n=1 Tax=Wolfiporia cocos (strain MD-104) TaxID=742152 RepID=A0A2H3JFS6_WOLCO|nr:hypothetical protein WOLCODRAFT_139614 [Wolfiporia cocos MD-104 SS10]